MCIGITCERLVGRVYLTAIWAGVGWVAGVLGVYLVLAWILRRRRIAAWDAEWERADCDWRRAT
jgi:hypothetical protein